MRAIASTPSAGREPCAARPRVSTSAQTKPLCATHARSAGGLGHDRRHRRCQRVEHGLHADARVLLVGHGRDDHVPARSSRREPSRGDHARRDAALHVVGAATVQAPVTHHAARTGRSMPATPTVSMWRVQHQRGAAAASRAPRRPRSDARAPPRPARPRARRRAARPRRTRRSRPRPPRPARARGSRSRWRRARRPARRSSSARRRRAGAGTGRPASSRTTASTSRSSSRTWPSVTASIRLRLRCEQLGHRLVDRVGREQVPGGHGALLADPVQAVLGLVVAGGRPVELEEGDVRGARERDPLRGGLHRADDQLRPVLALEGVHGALARHGSSRRRGCARASGKRSSTAFWVAMCSANTTSGSPDSRKSRDPGERGRAACRARRAGGGC